MKNIVKPKILLLGKPNCPLCDKARIIVTQVAEELQLVWEEKSILDYPNLEKEYREDIPVVFIDGKQHSFWTVNKKRLKQALT